MFHREIIHFEHLLFPWCIYSYSKFGQIPLGKKNYKCGLNTFILTETFDFLLQFSNGCHRKTQPQIELVRHLALKLECSVNY